MWQRHSKQPSPTSTTSVHGDRHQTCVPNKEHQQQQLKTECHQLVTLVSSNSNNDKDDNNNKGLKGKAGGHRLTVVLKRQDSTGPYSLKSLTNSLAFVLWGRFPTKMVRLFFSSCVFFSSSVRGRGWRFFCRAVSLSSTLRLLCVDDCLVASSRAVPASPTLLCPSCASPASWALSSSFWLGGGSTNGSGAANRSESASSFGAEAPNTNFDIKASGKAKAKPQYQKQGSRKSKIAKQENTCVERFPKRKVAHQAITTKPKNNTKKTTKRNSPCLMRH